MRCDWVTAPGDAALESPELRTPRSLSLFSVMMEDAEMVPVRTAGHVPLTLKERLATWAPGGPGSLCQNSKQICALCSFYTQWVDCRSATDSIMTQSHQGMDLLFCVVNVGRDLALYFSCWLDVGMWAWPSELEGAEFNSMIREILHM